MSKMPNSEKIFISFMVEKTKRWCNRCSWTRNWRFKIWEKSIDAKIDGLIKTVEDLVHLNDEIYDLEMDSYCDIEMDLDCDIEMDSDCDIEMDLDYEKPIHIQV